MGTYGKEKILSVTQYLQRLTELIMILQKNNFNRIQRKRKSYYRELTHKVMEAGTSKICRTSVPL